jgi:hypothetical protein
MGGASSLVLTRYRVTVEALERLQLPAYLGSTLRGAFGHAFRTLCCPGRPGEPCPAPASCPYHLVFETAPPPDATALRTHEEIARPFVLAAPPAGPRDYPPGSEGAIANGRPCGWERKAGSSWSAGDDRGV